MQIDPTIRHLVRHTFIEFMARYGVDRKFSAQEYDQALTMSNGVIVTRDHYAIRVRRTGLAAIPECIGKTGRAARVAIYETLQNAIRHATFEAGQ